MRRNNAEREPREPRGTVIGCPLDLYRDGKYGIFGQPLARKVDSGKPIGRLKAPDRMLGARSRPGARRAARGSELSAHHQTAWHGLAAVNVIAITAFAKG